MFLFFLGREDVRVVGEKNRFIHTQGFLIEVMVQRTRLPT